MKPRICVLGAGISGLTCAHELVEAGFEVTVVSDRDPMGTTSAIAAAIWYPFLAEPVNRTKQWALRSFLRFAELAYTPATGVRMVKFDEVGQTRLPYPNWADGSYHIQALSKPMCPPDFICGWRTMVPLIETPIFLPWLKNMLEELGVVFVKRFVTELSTLTEYGDLVVNCCGLAARELLDDQEVFPIRGQILSVTGSGMRRHITNDNDAPIPYYVLPRSNDFILGGSASKGREDLEPDPEETERILTGIRKLLPSAEIDRILEVKVGLRPGRTEVRLECEEITNGPYVIHNYGHGGSGVTLSWGCAEEVLTLVKAAIQ